MFQWRDLLLTAISAALYAAAFPPVGWFPLGWIALAPLFLALARAPSGAAAAALGALWGAVATLGVASWLPRMVAGFFDLRGATGWLAFAAVIALGVAPYYALFAWWTSWSTRRGRVHPAWIGAAWAVLEYGRASIGIADPWALLAHAQAAAPAMVQVADLGGAFLLSGLMAATAAAAAGIVEVRLRFGTRLRSSVLAVAIPTAVLGYGEFRLRETFHSGPGQRIGVVQGAVERNIRFRLEHQRDIVRGHLALTETAAEQGARVVLWPEFSIGVSLIDPSPMRLDLEAATRRLGVEIGVGGPGYTREPGGPRVTNAYFFVSDGRIAARHEKVRLMPFSEQNPFEREARAGTYRAANEPVLLDTRAGRIGVLLCSEAMHAEHVRDVVRRGATILANPSVDDWFESASAASQQLAAAQFRAVEQRRAVVRPTSSGITAVMDAHGRVVASLPPGEPGVLVSEVFPSDATTLYARIGDSVVWLAAIGLAARAASRIGIRR